MKQDILESLNDLQLDGETPISNQWARLVEVNRLKRMFAKVGDTHWWIRAKKIIEKLPKKHLEELGLLEDHEHITAIIKMCVSERKSEI